ncbi:MAG TPA: glycosyltransferase family 4 protein [Candidatus Limnocylindria bacterium]|nr:glycosyltransferase family 4 protein [Candidatus Limnocylindria bacterium]
MRILIVVQRYGAEVVGGSEAHARVVAQRLAKLNEVEVATTTALDYWTWAPHFAPGESLDGPVRVRRFPIASGRRADFKDIERHVTQEPHTLSEERDWLVTQGPHVPELLEFLHREGSRYDAILFYTYIYEPTAAGLPLVAERAALVSTAHDEAPLGLAPYRALFQLPRAFGFLTPEERDLVHARFANAHIPSEVIGMGLDAPPWHDGEPFRERYAQRGPLVAYVGQVSEGKAVDELLADWTAYREGGGAGTLVLAGTPRMALPEREDVVSLGRVSEEDKYALLEAADVLVLPSRFESLGIVLLEAWQVGTPCLVAARNPVTSGQVARAHGGAAYERDGFAGSLAAVLAKRDELGEAGNAYVARESAWPAFDARLEQLVDLVAR